MARCWLLAVLKFSSPYLQFHLIFDLQIAHTRLIDFLRETVNQCKQLCYLVRNDFVGPCLRSCTFPWIQGNVCLRLVISLQKRDECSTKKMHQVADLDLLCNRSTSAILFTSTGGVQFGAN